MIAVVVVFLLLFLLVLAYSKWFFFGGGVCLVCFSAQHAKLWCIPEVYAYKYVIIITIIMT